MKVDVNEYISSGILEAYVLGGLSEKECAEVEQLAAEYPEISAEIRAIETAMNKYAQLHNMQPSAGLKEKIMSQITGESETEAKVRALNLEEEEKRDPRNVMRWSIAASVLLMISLTINIYLSSRTINAERYLQELARKNVRKDSALKLAKAENDKAQADLAIFKDPMYKMVQLKGQAADTDAKALVCWCPGSKLVYFEAANMPALPNGMAYQLWAIVDGKPVNEGMITMGEGMHKMKDIDGATAFAVTMEKADNGDTPHGTMIVVGSIQSSDKG